MGFLSGLGGMFGKEKDNNSIDISEYITNFDKNGVNRRLINRYNNKNDTEIDADYVIDIICKQISLITTEVLEEYREKKGLITRKSAIKNNSIPDLNDSLFLKGEESKEYNDKLNKRFLTMTSLLSQEEKDTVNDIILNKGQIKKEKTKNEIVEKKAIENEKKIDIKDLVYRLKSETRNSELYLEIGKYLINNGNTEAGELFIFTSELLNNKKSYILFGKKNIIRGHINNNKLKILSNYMIYIYESSKYKKGLNIKL